MTELRQIRAQGVIEDNSTSYTYKRPSDRRNWLVGDLQDIVLHAQGCGATDTTEIDDFYRDSMTIKLPVPTYEVSRIKYSAKVKQQLKAKTKDKYGSSAMGLFSGLIAGIPISIGIMLALLVSPFIWTLSPLWIGIPIVLAVVIY